MTDMQYHRPVLLQEVMEGLDIQPGGTYVDATFGGGGHTRAMLEKLGPEGRVFGFDQDSDAWNNQPDDERFTLIRENFRHLYRFLRLYQGLPVDGLLADLGVSSHQFDTATRGFSTRFDAPLDMRMDMRNELTAASILQTYNEKQLHKLFEEYGEVSNARTLSRAIIEARRTHPLQTIRELKAVLQAIIRGNPQRYLAQVFQALRIEVNDELGALEELLQQAMQVLKPGGRLAVITFHSLEDRIVKNFIKNGPGISQEDINPFSTGRPEKRFQLVTKKPVTAGAEEIKENPRSRSAKLRIAEKI